MTKGFFNAADPRWCVTDTMQFPVHQLKTDLGLVLKKYKHHRRHLTDVFNQFFAGLTEK
jgi:hypothetical protein